MATSASSSTSNAAGTPPPGPAPSSWRSRLSSVSNRGWSLMGKIGGAVAGGTNLSLNLLRGGGRFLQGVYHFGKDAAQQGPRAASYKWILGTPPQSVQILHETVSEVLRTPEHLTPENWRSLHRSLREISPELWKEIHAQAPALQDWTALLLRATQAKINREHSLTPDTSEKLSQLEQALQAIMQNHKGFIPRIIENRGKQISHKKTLQKVLDRIEALRSQIDASTSRKKLLPLIQEIRSLLEFYQDHFEASPLSPPFDDLEAILDDYYSDPNAKQSGLLDPLNLAVIRVKQELAALSSFVNSTIEKGAAVMESLHQAIPSVLPPLPKTFSALPLPSPPAKEEETAVEEEEKPPVSAPPAVTKRSKGSALLGDVCSFILNQVSRTISSGVQRISDRGAQAIAFWLLDALQEALNAIEGKAGFDRHTAALKKIIKTISVREPDGTRKLKADLKLSILWEILKDHVDLFNSVDITLDGWLDVWKTTDLPFVGKSETSNPKKLLIQNSHIARQAKETKIEEETTDTGSWKDRARIESKLYVKNTTNFIVIKQIWERSCKFKPNNLLYYQLMQKANEAPHPVSKLRELFFEQLEKEGVGAFQRTCLKVYYAFTWKFTNMILKDVFEKISQKIFGLIEENRDTHYVSFRTQIIRNFNSYLEILGGGYRRIAADPKPTGDISKMLNKDLEDPTFNDGLTSSELYQKVGSSLIKEFTSWHHRLIVKAILGDGGQMIEQLLQSGVKSLSDSFGYTHALNTLLVEQFEELLPVIREQMATGKRTQKKKSSSEHVSEQKKKEVQALVKNILEILPMVNCKIIPELRKLVQGDSLLQKANKFIDTYLLERLVDNASEGITEILSNLLQEDRLYQLVYKMTSSLNRIYLEGDTSTLEEREATQKRVASLAGELLDLSLESAVDHYMTPSTEEKTTPTLPTQPYISRLQKSTALFVSQMGKYLEKLKTQDPLLSTPDAIQIVDTLLDKASIYQEKCLQELREMEMSELGNNNKASLRKRYEEAAKKAEPLISALATLKSSPHQLIHLETLKTEFSQLNQKTFQINSLLTKRNHFGERFDETIEFLESLKETVSRLKINTQEVDSLLESVSRLTKQLKKLDRHQSVFTRCKEQLTVAQEWLRSGKLTDTEQVIESLLQIPDPRIKDKLIQFVHKLSRIKSPVELQKQLKLFIDQLEGVLEEAETDCAKIRGEALVSNQAIVNQIRNNRLTRIVYLRTHHKAKIRSSLITAQRSARNLLQWSKTDLTDVLHYRMSSTMSEMISKKISSYVSAKVRGEIIDSLLKLIRSNQTYIFGLFHQQIFLPILRSRSEETHQM